MLLDDDFLDRLPDAVRGPIERDPERYAPFLGLLGGWKQAIHAHLEGAETRVARRLLQETAPDRDARYPMQLLAVPELPRTRELGPETTFLDGATPWTLPGVARTLPTRIDAWEVYPEGQGRYTLAFTVEREAREPDEPWLVGATDPGRDDGRWQLAFVAGDEPLVAALAAADWSIQYPGGRIEPIAASRYAGFLDLERALGASRTTQPHLTPLLPPFHPYGRKFLRFVARSDAAAGSGLPDGALRLLARIDAATYRQVRRHSPDQPLLILNAFPLVQMRTLAEPARRPAIDRSEVAVIPFAEVEDLVGASACQAGESADGPWRRFLSATLTRTPCPASRGFRPEAYAEVAAPWPPDPVGDFDLRIHFACQGADAATPRRLFHAGERFLVPFPAVGGRCLTIEGEAARFHAYHRHLRAPQLTEGDIHELVGQIPECRRWFDLTTPGAFSLQLDLVPERRDAPDPWASALWPSRLENGQWLDARADYLAASRVALTPLLRLHFRPGGDDAPPFLARDLARYAADVVSQFFLVGWYRVEGRLAIDA